MNWLSWGSKSKAVCTVAWTRWALFKLDRISGSHQINKLPYKYSIYSFQNAKILPRIVGTRYCNLFLIWRENILCCASLLVCQKLHWAIRSLYGENTSHLLMNLYLMWASKKPATFCSSGHIVVILNVVNR